MPELPEIELLRRDLEKEVVGKRIRDAEVRPGTNAMKVISGHGRRKEFQDLLAGVKIERAGRGGRSLLLVLDSGAVLVVDLGPTGRILKTSTSDALATHTHVVMSFTTGGQLRIVDPLKRAKVHVAGPDEDVAAGPPDGAIDPLESMITWQQFSALLDRGALPLKELLTDERYVIGLGDVYSDEILFVAGLQPGRASSSLTSSDVRRLYRAMGEVLHEALKGRGTSIGSDGYVDLHGRPGQFQLELKVYERDGESCRRCRSTIVREPFGDGYTHFCPQCQS